MINVSSVAVTRPQRHFRIIPVIPNVRCRLITLPRHTPSRKISGLSPRWDPMAQPPYGQARYTSKYPLLCMVRLSLLSQTIKQSNILSTQQFFSSSIITAELSAQFRLPAPPYRIVSQLFLLLNPIIPANVNSANVAGSGTTVSITKYAGCVHAQGARCHSNSNQTPRFSPLPAKPNLHIPSR